MKEEDDKPKKLKVECAIEKERRDLIKTASVFVMFTKMCFWQIIFLKVDSIVLIFFFFS